MTELEIKILEANKAYRTGNSIISDSEYDLLIELLIETNPNSPILSQVGIEIDDSRKSKLPIEMASMNKEKSIEGIKNWCRLKGIPTTEDVILTPKLDGLSFCVEEDVNEAWTRGDGEYGQKSDEHYKLIQNHLENVDVFEYTYGEVIMPKSVFNEKYSVEFANPRNLVAGKINSKEVTETLKDIVYIKYGGVLKDSSVVKTKKEVLDLLNAGQSVTIPYEVIKINELKEERLLDLFKNWSIDYEIDGIILEVNSLKLQEKLGRETSTNNPVWARAFKSPKFEQTAESEVIGITWNISKQGLLKPTLNIVPVHLDGVTISNITGNNARYIMENGLGKGALIEVKRSGMVIPIVERVIKTVEWEMPVIEGVTLEWNENGVELVTTTETDDQKIKQLISFFKILEAKNVSEGVITQLWNAGYDTVKRILLGKKEDFQELDGFGVRKAEIVYNSLQNCIKDVPLSKLQHASGLFWGLGSKKLVLLEHFVTKPTLEQIMEIEGFAMKSALSYLDGYDKFNDFIKDLPITIKKVSLAKVDIEGASLEGQSFVFTGVRRADLEKEIESLGGKIGSSVSKNTTYLVMKEKGSGSSKEVKALGLGVKIFTVEELEGFLKSF